MRKYLVYCPHCKKYVLESDPNIDTTIVPNGMMFHQVNRLKARQRHQRGAHIKGQNFPCPLCMNPLTGMYGHLTLKCLSTGEVFKTGNNPPVVVDLVAEAAKKRQAEMAKAMRRKRF